MSALERLIPNPRLVERDHVDVAAPPARVFEHLGDADLARSPMVRALFALRELPRRLAGEPAAGAPRGLRIPDLVSTPERPGFQLLAYDEPRELAIGAIGKVWRGRIPFLHVDGAADYAELAEPGWIKVAWAMHVLPRGERDARVELELRVAATDEASWTKFRRYFRLIGPASQLIRRLALAELARDLGRPDSLEDERPLPGDELLADAGSQTTHFVDIAAPPEAIWPWLVQLGCHRGGFYSYDALDNGGAPSAREVHPELQGLAVGDVVAASPKGADGFEVLRLEPPHVLVLGGLYDHAAKRQLAFAAQRPARYWQATWAFALERLDEGTTRLHVRVRAAFAARGVEGHFVRFVHPFMQRAQLRHLRARVEGRLPRDGWRDVAEGIGGGLQMAASALTPFLRERRSHSGLSPAEASQRYPGDELVEPPSWGWTHAIEIDARAEDVWPWVAQLGASRAGFYSYQWLENVAGCELRNAEAVHPEWALQVGDELSFHPKLPPARIVALDPGAALLAHVPVDAVAFAEGRPWVTMSWLLRLEPLAAGRCRLVSRYRADCSDDLATRLSFGPSLLEPVAFVMDRRMLAGIKERAEHALAERMSRDARRPLEQEM